MSKSKSRPQSTQRGSSTVTNPFNAPAADEQTVTDQPADTTATETPAPTVEEIPVADEELNEVDTPAQNDEELETVNAPAAASGEGATPAPAKAEKAPARPEVPSGYITPVQFAKALTKHLAEKGVSNKNGKIGRKEDDTIDLNHNPIPPQYIYSVLNQGKKAGAKNPLPSYSEGGRENLLKLEEALAWWDAKDQRVADSKTAKAEKEAKKAAKAEAGTPDAPSAAATEPAAPVAEAE